MCRSAEFLTEPKYRSMGKCKSIAMFVSRDDWMTRMTNKSKDKYTSLLTFFLWDLLNRFRLVSNDKKITSRLLEKQVNTDNTTPMSRILSWVISMELRYSVEIYALLRGRLGLMKSGAA